MRLRAQVTCARCPAVAEYWALVSISVTSSYDPTSGDHGDVVAQLDTEPPEDWRRNGWSIYGAPWFLCPDCARP